MDKFVEKSLGVVHHLGKAGEHADDPTYEPGRIKNTEGNVKTYLEAYQKGDVDFFIKNYNSLEGKDR
ncbi:MAG: hypothetical protein D3914_06380 [Candidatus Electrothrix sp. LOE2]|nr:hypothetical protein [Candidatus Electrothrix sp. LOE2]